ncbi:MAG: alpha/beta-hydrolase family protein [Deltaproteobacteria bacterium]|jgi:uncharacterized membrane protein|nr:alpha/beta-hydrolase family protein [Deltaproteobacteria bacterium]
MPFIQRILSAFSFVGLIFGLAFFCASLTPSLLPRESFDQGLLSGFVFAAGYGIGRLGHWIWTFMELRELTGRFARLLKWILLLILAEIGIYTLYLMKDWQNSIRVLMEMPSIETAYPLTVLLIAAVTALAVILLAYLVIYAASLLVKVINRYLPHRVAIVMGWSLFVTLLMSFVDGVILKASLHVMDESFAAMNRLLDDEYAPPNDIKASGSSQSLIDWSDIGRNGKRYVAHGPTRAEISSLIGREAMQPIRVYAGFDTGETLQERAKIALAELQRVGGFERSTLIVATATGTGWLDPSAVDPVEYMHAGDIATVSLQYSYLPSWLTLMVEPELAQQAAKALFKEIYGYWTRLPRDRRPELYLHGLSLGALGSEYSADLVTMIADPVSGALWSGPPFLSKTWSEVTMGRNPDSPEWRPVFRDSAMIRFMTQQGFPRLRGAEWGPVRFVYLQHASDPMSFFSTNLAYERPDWLGPERGHDVSPYLRWVPLVTFFQIGFDIPAATSVPIGYGHNFAPASYIDAWVEVTQPKNWTSADTLNLKSHFVGFNPRPL